MIQVDGIKYFTPREIANEAMIVNSKNKGDYAFVLALINNGKLQAKPLNEGKHRVYKVVAETEIERYNKERFNPAVKL